MSNTDATYVAAANGLTMNSFIMAGRKRLESMGYRVVKFPSRPGWNRWSKYTVVGSDGLEVDKMVRYLLSESRWEVKSV